MTLGRSMALETLRRSRELEDALNRLREQEVRVARHVGASWADIGRELGTSHVTAAARWGEEKKTMLDQGMEKWDITPGEDILRSTVHDRFGGNRQRGISPTTNEILLFSEAGEQHGYFDGPDPSGKFYIYTGEGQNGDQTITVGNKAIAEHLDTGRPLRLFEGARGTVKYLGEYQLDHYEWDEAHQTGSPGLRQVIKFWLRPV
jgi:hypothetical protein